jgi:hypothetical protein
MNADLKIDVSPASTGYCSFRLPPEPNWRLDVANGSIVIHRHGAPCWFFRITQRLILGFKWSRLKNRT